jgi:Rrf2 family protein
MAANSRFAMATHIMTSLAFHSDEIVSSAYLASSLNTNSVVVRRILGALHRAGLLETLAGRSGGARLSQKPSSISLYDIFAAVDEENLFSYNPNDPNKKCPLSCQMKSVLEPIFDSANEALAQYLKRVRLSELVSQTNKKIEHSQKDRK